MRSLCHKLFGLAVLFILAMAFPRFVRAQSSASCDIPNVDQTTYDQYGNNLDRACDASETCPSGLCSTRRLNTPRRLTLAVKFVKPNKKYAIFVLPGKNSATE